MPTVYRILIGYALITAVALISDRSRALAGIAATMPINITIILWIIWGKSAGEYSNIQDVSRSMLTARPVGMEAMTSGSSTYRPALM